MPQLNYKHLRYLFETVRLGSVQAAAEVLHVSPQAVSAQIKQLEGRIGQRLLTRQGRTLRPTDAGQVALAYARQIFELGDELSALLADHPGELTVPCRIGLTDSVPKSMAVVCTTGLIAGESGREAVFVEGPLDDLLARLLAGRLHAILSEREPSGGDLTELDIRMLVRAPLAWVATPAYAERLTGTFPHHLDGQAVILWQAGSVISSQVSAWMEANHVRPRIVARCVDSALIKSLCAAGVGAAPVPLAIADTVHAQMGLVTLGVMDAVEMSLWLIQRRGQVIDDIAWPGV
ncbi:MAG: LysR family transcriptional regulator [Abyssibacter sp.]|uniref:LysR family transcriptional regulator n=1 Tax=Abyssibacter sp. TaxID=2320200 RepID=UPI00321977C6